VLKHAKATSTLSTDATSMEAYLDLACLASLAPSTGLLVVQSRHFGLHLAAN
jgi:hypothetical protein